MKKFNRKLLALVLAAVMVAGLFTSVFAANVGPFTDVSERSWYAPYVRYVYEEKLMLGMSETTFAPKQGLTRAQAAMLLYRLAGEPEVDEPATFTDLKQDWYKDAVAWAEDEAVILGTGKGFEPDAYITRQDMFTMLWRFVGKTVDKDENLNYSDAKQIADYAEEAINFFSAIGVVEGSNGKVDPQGNLTRAEAAALLSRFDKTEVNCLNGAHCYHDGVCHCGKEVAEEGDIVIYYTNDIHTYIDNPLSYAQIAHLRANSGENTLLVDAGDHIQGTAFGSMDKGETMIKLMKSAGYDLATLGNHEFDYTMTRTLEVIEEFGKYVSCNFYHEENGVIGETVLEPYHIFEIGGKKIAFVGITTPESFTKSTPAYFQDEEGNYIYGIAGGSDGKALYDTVQKAIDAAKAAGADMVIALGHLGDDLSSKPWTSEELIANTTGLSAFIDGHSHSTVERREVTDKAGKTVVLTQTGSYFNAIGKMVISADGTIRTQLIEAYAGSDEATAEIADAWIEETNKQLGKVIGKLDGVTLDNYASIDGKSVRLVRSVETNTGDFCADALYYLFDNMGLDVDFAIMNGGGIRNASVTGDVSYLTCKSIHTFGNVACLITVKGQQILDALEWGARFAGSGQECGGFLQVSGLKYTIDSSVANTVKSDEKGVWTGGPDAYRVKDVQVWDKKTQTWVALDLTKDYNMAGYNYTLRDLGDGFAMFKGAVNVLDYVMEDYMVLANYLNYFENGVINAESKGIMGTTYGDVYGSGRIVIK